MLTGLGAFIAIVAGLFSMVYSIQILILNFQENILWGLASLFLGFPMWVFVALRWDKAGSPFLKSLVASAVACLGVGMMFMGAN